MYLYIEPRSEEMDYALINNKISKYSIPDYIIMDQESPFLSSLMNYLLKTFVIKSKTVAPYNHQSLQAEYDINEWFRSNVAKTLSFAMPVCNTFHSSNPASYSLGMNPDIKVSCGN